MWKVVVTEYIKEKGCEQKHEFKYRFEDAEAARKKYRELILYLKSRKDALNYFLTTDASRWTVTIEIIENHLINACKFFDMLNYLGKKGEQHGLC